MLNRDYKKSLIAKYARSVEDDALLARLLDKYEVWERNGTEQNTRFLSERDLLCCIPVCKELGIEPILWGGYPEAERKVLVFPAAWQEETHILHGDDCPVTVLRASFHSGESLSHRDFLGALMGLGVERDTIGDIIPREGSCDIVLTREVAAYVKDNLLTAGKAALKLTVIPEAEAQAAAVRVIRDTVASLRLDAVVGVGFSLAREKAAAAIRTGKVAVNSMECLKPDKLVEAGSKISLRGLGKILLYEVGGLSKKGRTSIVIHRYI